MIGEKRRRFDELSQTGMANGFDEVSEGLELILKTREVDLGFLRQKQYLVKYKDLGHVHTRWMSESEVLLKAPSLIHQYYEKCQAQVDVPGTTTSNDSLEPALQVTPSQQLICDEATIDRPDVETPSATLPLSEAQESIVPLTSPLSEDLESIVPLTSPLSEDLESIVPLTSPLSEDQKSIVLLISALSEGQESIAPLTSALPEGQESIAPLTSALPEGQESIAPLTSALPEGQESIPPLTSALPEGHESIVPLTSALSEGQKSNVLTSALPEVQESIVPLTPALSEGHESIVPLTPALSEGHESIVPLVSGLSESQESIVPLKSALYEGQESIVPLNSALSEVVGVSDRPFLEYVGASENQNPVQSACSLPLTSTGLHVRAAETIEMHNILHQFVSQLFCPVDFDASGELRRETSIFETGMQVHPVPSVESLLSHSLSPASICVTGGSNEYPIVNEITQHSMQQMENCLEVPLHRAMLPPEAVAARPTVNLTMGSTRVTDGWMPSTNLLLDSLNMQNAISSVVAPPSPLYQDPLLNEMEKIRTELDQTTVIYEESKKETLTVWEKERDEAVAQIRRKYEALLKEETDSFQLKKKELDDNHDKVLRGKLLAEVFKSSCRVDWTPGSQDANFAYLRQLAEPPSRDPAPGSSIITGCPSAVPSAQTPSFTPNPNGLPSVAASRPSAQTPSFSPNSNGLPSLAVPRPMVNQSSDLTRPPNSFSLPQLGGQMFDGESVQHYQSSLPSTSR